MKYEILDPYTVWTLSFVLTVDIKAHYKLPHLKCCAVYQPCTAIPSEHHAQNGAESLMLLV